MSDFTITATNSSGSLDFSGAQGSGASLNGDTITFQTGTITVSIVQGTGVTLASSLSLPTAFSTTLVSVSPSSASRSNDQYVFTCTNGLTSAASTVTSSCTVTATIAGLQTTGFPELTKEIHVCYKDPTMIFNPPQ